MNCENIAGRVKKPPTFSHRHLGMTLTSIALVTGASRGIGRAIALRLAADGFDVAINDLPRSRRNLEAVASDISARGRKAYIATADVSSDKQVETMVESVVNQLKRLDVVRSSQSETVRLVLPFFF
jgi:NAD(P)-dependent dehydrogenase (short-subunit alcohol dehydrogenase family)